jgi:hypothetical protein
MPRKKVTIERRRDPTPKIERILREFQRRLVAWKRCKVPRCRRKHHCCREERFCTAKPPVSRSECEALGLELERAYERRQAKRRAQKANRRAAPLHP